MLTEICDYLQNWFNKRPDSTEMPKYFGRFSISSGDISYESGKEIPLAEYQYYRIQGSVFNNGVHRFGDRLDTDENFDGVIWAMAVPQDVIDLAKEIDDWLKKYGGADSVALSPFNSESFGGYSYSKSSGGYGGSSGAYSPASAWQSIFANRLNRYRRYR